MTTSSAETPKVFISYTHDSPEHVDRVLELADRLRAGGVDAHVDQYETSPPEGWPRWTVRQIEEADYVLTVFTETYQRRFKGEEESGIKRMRDVTVEERLAKLRFRHLPPAEMEPGLLEPEQLEVIDQEGGH